MKYLQFLIPYSFSGFTDVNVKDSTDDSWSENEGKMFEKNPHFQEDRAEEEEVDFYLNLFDMSHRLTIASQKFNK